MPFAAISAFRALYWDSGDFCSQQQTSLRKSFNLPFVIIIANELKGRKQVLEILSESKIKKVK